MFKRLGLAALLTGSLLFGADERTPLPLDLPSGRGFAEEEEDESESIIFYGQEYEGSSFIWLLDRSGSMSGPKMNTLKQETTNAIQSLSRRALFSVGSFGSNYSFWQDMTVRATPQNKGSAVAYVNNLVPYGGTYLSDAGVAMVNINNQSDRRRRQMIVVGDGLPADGAPSLTNITFANYERDPINTIYISPDDSGRDFMQTLADMNEGSCSTP